MRPTQGPWTSSLFNSNGATSGASRVRNDRATRFTTRRSEAEGGRLALEHGPVIRDLRADRGWTARPGRTAPLHSDAGPNQGRRVGVDRLARQLAQATLPREMATDQLADDGVRFTERHPVHDQVLGEVGR